MIPTTIEFFYEILIKKESSYDIHSRPKIALHHVIYLTISIKFFSFAIP